VKRHLGWWTIFIALYGATAFGQTAQNTAKGFAADKAYEIGAVDQINVFNGNVNVNIPLGGTYQVSSALSYQLVLRYSGNVWEHYSEWVNKPRPEGGFDEVLAEHAELSEYGWNAGVGWSVSLGELRDNTYLSPDGAVHKFYSTMRPGETAVAGVSYTRNGTYLRLKGRVVEFPDGTRHTFNTAGKLIAMSDRFGNVVTISWVAGTDSAEDWTITDGFRTHHVDMKRFARSGERAYDMVKSVSLSVTGVRDAVYTFSYADTDQLIPISRKLARKQNCSFSKYVYAPVLERVTLPDTSTYEMTTSHGDVTRDAQGNVTAATYALTRGTAPYSETCTPVFHQSYSGHLSGLKLPVGGSIEWTYQEYGFSARWNPDHECNDGVLKCKLSVSGRHGFGVLDRFERDLSGNVTGKRTYATDVQVTQISTPVLRNEISAWQGFASDGTGGTEVSKTVHFYTIPLTSSATVQEYGLPFMRDVIASTSGSAEPPNPDPTSSSRLLSTKEYEGTKLVRYSYLEYESDTDDTPDAVSLNRRVKSQRVVDVIRGVNSDGSESVAWQDVITASDSFDDLGHYRNTKTSESAGTLERNVQTNYNPSGRPPATSNWLVNLYNHIEVNDVRTAPASGSETRRTEYCFDPATGFLKWTRVPRGATPANDLLAVFHDEPSGSTVIDGNISREKYYGGDGVGDAISSSFTGQCTSAAMPDLGAARYEIRHTYSNGVRATSHHANAVFKMLDLTIGAAGLPTASRDGAGISATFVYDTSGRLKKHAPDQRAVTEYVYTPASGTTPAEVRVRQCAVATENCSSNALTEARHYYDGFGRLRESRKRLPPSPAGIARWAAQWITYDDRGRKESVSVPVEVASGESGTIPALTPATFWTYDTRGRVLTMTQPDNEELQYSYSGSRVSTRSSEIQTSAGAEVVSVRETRDFLGRLRQVDEDPDQLALVTSYDYDVADRLKSVNGPRATGVATLAPRTFTYDGAGLLLSEVQPESGTTSYAKYDARGHLLEKRTPDCKFDLNYTYDSSERLTHVKGRSGYPGADWCAINTWRTLREWRYEPSAAPGDHGRGKLREAIRYNPTGSVGLIKVSETFLYGDVAGRPSLKTTDVVDATSGTRIQTFEQQFRYGPLDEHTAAGYPVCIYRGCGEPAYDGAVSGYSNGFLTKVGTFTGSIDDPDATPTQLVALSRHANGIAVKVEHANGVTDTIEPDSGMTRPATISFSGYDQSCVLPVVSVTAAPATVSYGGSTTLTAGVTGPDTSSVTYQWHSQYGSEIAGATASTYTTPALYEGDAFRVFVTAECGRIESAPISIGITVPSPANLVVTRVGTTTQVGLSWAAVAGASSYRAERRNAGVWQVIGTPSTAFYTDAGCGAGNACIYRVRAVTSSGQQSAPGNAEIATLVAFTSVVEGQTVVSVAHFNQLLTAVNAIRAAAGWSAVSWSSLLATSVPPPEMYGPVYDDHIKALRTSMDEALLAHGIAIVGYADSLIQPTRIKAIHILQLQERTK
jgi:YD repeat-containing protein